MSLVGDFLSGIHRYFPTMMTTTLIFVGLLLAKLNWILVALGSLLLAGVVAFFQIFFSTHRGAWNTLYDSDLTGAAILEVCGIIPSSAGGVHTRIPSMWVALVTYYFIYILRNAISVYATKPATAAAAASSSAMQRKSVGIISIVTTVLMFLILIVARLTTSCEHWGGVIFGLILGTGAAVGWWYVLRACGADYYPDIHSVMLGLNPGGLHTTAIACTRT